MDIQRFRAWMFGWLGLVAASAVHADLVFTSAPRDDKATEEAIYRPVADLLSKAAGTKVTFKYGDTFLVYQSEMRKGTYDIIFDGPAFVGWRMDKLQHVPIVKFPGKLVFVLAVKKNNNRVNVVKDMAGRTLCAFPPPNLATLTVLDQFDNPARVPLILETESFPDSYKSMVAGKCVGAILQKRLFENLDKEKQNGKVIFTSSPLPNQAFSAGPKVTPEMRDRMAKALLAPEGQKATEKMRGMFKQKNFEAADPKEFEGLGKILRDVYGFGS